MKTIEELGQLAHEAWRGYWWRDKSAPRSQQEAFTEVAKAIVTALVEDGVSWAPGDDETELTTEEFDARAADGEPVLIAGVETGRVRFEEVFDRVVKDNDETLRRLADD
jgi:hypothetical protein